MIVGIDLGTTHSLVGVYDAGLVALLAGAEGDFLTPSVVYFPETGDPVVGQAALRSGTLHPARTVVSIKRMMGRRVGEELVDDLAYPIVGVPGTPARVQLGQRHFSPEEISAFILRKLRADAERALGCEVRQAVITVPAYFNDAQRNATKSAAEMAGLEAVRILNEPTAAALAYGLERLEEKGRIAVYDLGGGTFDISILEMNGGVFQVLSTHGNTRLGGDDIDARIADAFAGRLGVEVPGPELASRLRELAREAKHHLSEAETFLVRIPFAEGQAKEWTFTRADLERLALPILERTRASCVRALADARLEASDLREVILVGGSTRMPLVRRLVEEIFGKAPNLSQNPDEAVARGATLQAAILSGALNEVVLLDVTPLSLGIETFGGLMNVIIPRNTTIPCKAGEMFTNAVAGQRSMLLRVLQGEREMAADNWELGRFELPFEPASKGQARVGVQFAIDANGILSVLARDTRTGSEQVVQMTSAVDVSDEAVEKMLEQSLENAFEDMNARVLTEARLKAEEMIPAVELALKRVGDRLEESERQVIQSALEGVERAMQSGAAQPLKRATQALDEATQRLATLLLETAMSAPTGEPSNSAEASLGAP